MDYKTFQQAVNVESNNKDYAYSNVVVLVDGIEYNVEEIEFTNSFIKGRRVIIATGCRDDT